MNTKQFKSWVKNLAETKAVNIFLTNAKAFTIGGDSVNVIFEEAGTSKKDGDSIYFCKSEDLLVISKKLKASKDEVTFTFENGTLSVHAGLAIYDCPAKRVDADPKASVDLTISETVEGAESLKQFLITASSVPQKDEGEFLPVTSKVHLFAQVDKGILSLEGFTSVEEEQLSLPLSTSKPIKGCFLKSELAKAAKPLKSLGYAEQAKVFLRKNKKFAKLCIELRDSNGTLMTISMPLALKSLESPLLPIYDTEDGVVLLDDGTDGSLVDQIGSIGVDLPTKASASIAREFQETATVFSTDSCVVIADNFLQHCLTNKRTS